MASKEDKDVQMKEPKEGEEDPKAEERGDSFYVKLLDVDRKKTNGEGEIDEEIELTPEDMKRLTTEWVGKKINLRHDLKGGFGKITAAWHTKDGKTHVRLTPGTSKAGKTAAKMIKDGEITSVSAGWQVHKDKNSGRVVNKSADHVALTNLPVYEGTVIYAMASKDAGIQPDRDGVLRTKGGLAVLPVIENSNAAIRVDNMMVGASDGNEALERGSECLRKPTNSENAKGVTTNDDNDDEVTPPQNAIESLWTSLFENLASSSVSPFHRASGKENTKGGSNDKDITESPNKGLFALSAISGNPEKQKEQQIEKEPASLKKNPSTFGIFGMASTEAPTTPTTTEAPDSAKVNDNAGDNATTQMMDAIFGGVKGQPRDNLGRFARKATNAPSSSSGGQKRPLESTETTDTQEESKRLALESAPSALEKTLDNDTPVSVDADTFRHYTNQELENKQLKKRIKSLTEENARWDALGRATGTRDIEGAKHIIEKATDDYAQSEMSKIKTAMNYLGELAKRIEAPEWKAHVETTEKRMGDLANNKQEILSENYSQNSQPIVSAVVAASYDIQRQVGNANAEASEWKIKYEEERAARIRMEEHLNVLERGNRSATSSWSVHASRDSATSASSPSSSTSGLGLPASSSGTSASSSLFSKPASNMGSASYTTSDIFTSSSSHPLYSASSSSSVGSSTYAPSTKNAPDLSEKKVHFEESPRGGVDSGMVHQENVHHTAVQFSSPMEAIGSTIHPHFAEAMSLTKQRRAHIYGNHRESISAGNVQKENAKQLRSADVLPEDMSDWGKVFGRTNIRQPMYGNVVFT